MYGYGGTRRRFNGPAGKHATDPAMTGTADPKRFLLQRFMNKVDEIEATWSRLRDASWREATPRTLQGQLRALASSGAIFGFNRVADGARACERFLALHLENGVEMTPAEKSRMNAGVAGLKRAVAGLDMAGDPAVTSGLLPAAPDAAERHLFLVMGDAPMAAEVARRMLFCGYRVHDFKTLDDMSLAIHRAPPCAVLLDIALADQNRADVTTHLQNIRAVSAALLFVSTRTDLDARLHAVRAGGDAYFALPLDLEALTIRLDQIMALAAPEPFRVLVIDDSPLQAQHHASILQQAGMRVQIVTQPGEAITALIEFRPDLILLDLYMPRCNGLELATVIRQKQDYLGVPIVFLSGEADIEKQLASMSLGADDFLVKPMAPAHLVIAVTHRARRFRALRGFMMRDSLTRLLNHATVKEQLELEVSRARRRGASLVLGMLDLDHFKSVNDRYGHVVGDQVIRNLARLLQQRLRSTDAVGRYGGEEFAVVMTDIDGIQATAVMEELRTAFEDMPQLADGKTFSITFSCGLAIFPACPDAAGLVQAADKALYEAKHAGRNCIVLG